ncbi:hypothetical protein MBLNU459_g3563t2 [Dothideomycetes sp. NU459]
MEDTYDAGNQDARPSRNIAWYLVSRDCKDSDFLLLRGGKADEEARGSAGRIKSSMSDEATSRLGSIQKSDENGEDRTQGGAKSLQNQDEMDVITELRGIRRDTTMHAASFHSVLKLSLLSLAVPTSIYFGILGLLIALPSSQTHVFYLHRISLTNFDLNVPEMLGFLPKQVRPFTIPTDDGELLHAWHILPLGVYRRAEKQLLVQPPGLVQDIASQKTFQLLRDDPDARLVIYLHGTSGTIGSGWRPDSYRAIYSAAPDKIHVLAVEYRGYGLSSGTPSEEGLLRDAVATVNWAMLVARIPPSRIVIFEQSLGTAVAISVAKHFTTQSPSVSFAGLVLVASFTDVATLTGTYRIGGTIPVLGPLNIAPRLFSFFTGFLQSTWMSKDRIAELVRYGESEDAGTKNYHITMIHAEDDTDIPFLHTQMLYWYAVNATSPAGLSYDELELEKKSKKIDLGPGGWVMEWRTKRGLIREQILKHGVHDKLMAYPVAGMAVLRAFQEADPTFEL